MSEKLQKLLAHAGRGSRREIETWIESGRVTVNGKRAKLGDRASGEDRILLDGKPVRILSKRDEKLYVIAYNKPEGEICTRKDPKGRPTIFDGLPLIPNSRWVSVGRLDINTSGLILLTNNGELANKLMHPSTEIEREYLVRIHGALSEQSMEKLLKTGVMLDGKKAIFERVFAADEGEMGTNRWYRAVIKEGRYREVRRMFDAVGHEVSRLKRIRYGTVKLTRDLKQKKHRRLAPMQLQKLLSEGGLADQFSAFPPSDKRAPARAHSTRPAKNINRAKSNRVQQRTSRKKVGQVKD